MMNTINLSKGIFFLHLSVYSLHLTKENATILNLSSINVFLLNICIFIQRKGEFVFMDRSENLFT